MGDGVGREAGVGGGGDRDTAVPLNLLLGSVLRVLLKVLLSEGPTADGAGPSGDEDGLRLRGSYVLLVVVAAPRWGEGNVRVGGGGGRRRQRRDRLRAAKCADGAAADSCCLSH